MASLAEQINDLEPGTLRIFRDSEDDIGFREALIFLDGEETACVEFKDILELPVRPGTHTLRASNRVFKTKPIEFQVRPGERLSFQVANIGGLGFIFFMMMNLGIPKIRLEMEAPEVPQQRGRKERKGHVSSHTNFGI